MLMYVCTCTLYPCRDIRDGIRSQLMDPGLLNHLEGCGSINYSNVVLWQCRPISGGVWSYLDGLIRGTYTCMYTCIM